MSELKECIVKCSKCSSLVTLKQFMQYPHGGFSQLEVDKEVVTTQNKICINGQYIYLNMFGEEGDIGLKRIKGLWKTWIERGHARYMDGQGNDYALIIDLVCPDEQAGKAYTISFINPVFMGTESDSLEMAFPLDGMQYEVVEVDYLEIENELEYEEEVKETTAKRLYLDEVGGNNAFSENDGIISNDDILSNEDLLTLQ